MKKGESPKDENQGLILQSYLGDTVWRERLTWRRRRLELIPKDLQMEGEKGVNSTLGKRRLRRHRKGWKNKKRKAIPLSEEARKASCRGEGKERSFGESSIKQKRGELASNLPARDVGGTASEGGHVKSSTGSCIRESPVPEGHEQNGPQSA